MRYTYEHHNAQGQRLDTFIRINQKIDLKEGDYINVTDNVNPKKGIVAVLKNQDDIADWELTIARAWQWSDKEEKERIEAQIRERFLTGTKKEEPKIIQINGEQFKIGKMYQSGDITAQELIPLNEAEKLVEAIGKAGATLAEIKPEPPCGGKVPCQDLPLGQIKFDTSIVSITGSAEGHGGQYNAQGDAKHYQDIIPGFQYLELMLLMYPADFMEGFLRITIDGYYMRFGKKDPKKQEVIKILWYTRFLTAFLLNDRKPFKIADIPQILANAGVK